MKYLAAYLLAVLGGDNAPSAAKVTEILDSVGIKAEEEPLTQLLEALKGKDIDTLVSEGSERLSSVIGAGGAAAAAPAAAGDAAAEDGGDAAAEEEEEDESDEDVGGLGLFGDDSDSDSDSD